jgi:hypothetical protein
MNRISVAALLGILAIAPSAAQAQTTITACYVPKTGSIYRIKAPDSPDNCKASHVEFSWETDVTVGYGVRTGIPLTQQLWPDETESFHAPCQDGEVAVGGGFSAGGPALVIYDGPYPDNTGWYVTLKNPGVPPYYVTARAICLALPN